MIIIIRTDHKYTHSLFILFLILGSLLECTFSFKYTQVSRGRLSSPRSVTCRRMQKNRGSGVERLALVAFCMDQTGISVAAV